MLIRRLFLVGVLCVGGNAAAQSGCAIVHHSLPDDLQSSLEERFSKFVAAQAEEHWGDVADLLGRCRFGCNHHGNLYTNSYKQCIVSRMQEVRMRAFDFSTQNLSACTPAGVESATEAVIRPIAEQLSWYLNGTGTFQTSSEGWTENTPVIAYRDQDQWYFTPAQWKMQDKWEKAHYTKADFARDRKDEIEVRNSPSSPVEITEVHVYMDRQDASSRNMTFKLHNKTSKKVVALDMGIISDDKSGAVFFGGGTYQIEPKGYLAGEQDFSAYSDFCDGIWKQTMAIDAVDFADGSRWQDKRPAKSK